MWIKKSIQVLDKKVANMDKTTSNLKEKYGNMKEKIIKEIETLGKKNKFWN